MRVRDARDFIYKRDATPRSPPPYRILRTHARPRASKGVSRREGNRLLSLRNSLKLKLQTLLTPRRDRANPTNDI